MAVIPKIGLLGGSFDPVHKAHIALAQAAITSLGLDSLQLIPAGQPWQKEKLKANNEQRLEMLTIASKGLAKININTVEIDRSGATYTIDTLESLPKGPKYYWVMGSDQLANFCSWHRWQDIIRLVDLAVAKRPNSKLIAPKQLSIALNENHIVEIQFDPINVSATQIRNYLEKDIDCSKYIDSNVLTYIKENNIYRPL